MQRVTHDAHATSISVTQSESQKKKALFLNYYIMFNELYYYYLFD